MNTVDPLQSFKLFLIRKGDKKSTIEGNIYHIKRFLKNYSIELYEEYLSSLIERGNKHSTVNDSVVALRKYGQFLNNEKLKNIAFFKVDKNTHKSIMQGDEISDFLKLKAPNFLGGKYLWHYNKMKLFWMCLSYSGARTGEIANLTIDDVDFGREVFMVDGKTGKRNVPISSVLTQPLKEHILLLKGKYLFPSMRTDRPIERATWDYDFKQRLKRLGIKRERLTPYSLRHSFITRMLEEDINLFKVQKIVGHRQIATTAIYTHLTTKDVVATIKKDPLGRSRMDFAERFKLFRDNVRMLLETYALTPTEEKKMLDNLS